MSAATTDIPGAAFLRRLPTRRRKNTPAPIDLDTIPVAGEATELPEPASTSNLPSSIDYMHRHLAVTSEGTWAWYLLPGEFFGGRSSDEIDNATSEFAHVWSTLTGYTCHVVQTSDPFPIAQYRAALHTAYPTPAVTPEGAHTFDDLVDDAARYIISARASRPLIALGVLIDPYRVPREHMPAVLSDEPAPDRLGNIETIRRAVKRLTKSITIDRTPTAGTNRGKVGVPMTEDALDWLSTAMTALGHPTRQVTNVHATSDPYARSVRIDATIAGRRHTRYTSIVRFVDAIKRDRITGVPVLAWANRVRMDATPTTRPVTIDDYRDRGVDWTARFHVWDGPDLRPKALRQLRVTKSIRSHNEEHGHGDEELGDVNAYHDAQRVVAEINDPRPEVSVRLVGQIMFAVSGATPEEAEDRAASLIERASREAKMALVHEYAQFEDYRCFAPAAAWPMKGHISQVSVDWFASMRPTAAGPRGDITGWPMGIPDGWTMPYLLDPHGGSRRNRANAVAIGGGLGCGKTTLATRICYLETRSGIPGAAYDASGLMTTLAKVSSLRNEYREVPVTRGKPGVLQPSLLIPDPQRVDYDTDEEYQDAVIKTRGDRRDIEADALRSILSIETQQQAGKISLQRRLISAIREAPGHDGAFGGNPWDTLDALHAQGGVSRDIADELRDAADSAHGSRIFPKRGKDIDIDATMRDIMSSGMTLITTPGIAMPPKGVKDRTQWTSEQRQAVTIMRLSMLLASRRIWADRKPKWFFGDELGLMTSGDSPFTPYLVRMLYDNRKFDADVILAFQTFSIARRIDENISTLFGMKIMGATASDDVPDSLPFMGLPVGQGWERRIAAQKPGTFTFSDWDRQVFQMPVDQAWWEPELRAATYTTPNALSLSPVRTASGEW